MNRLVEEIWLDAPTTIVFITHSIEEAIFLSDRVIVLSPRPGTVFEISTYADERSDADLIELAEATTAIDAATWVDRYGD